MQILKYVILIICAYFVGNISFARIISRLKKDDITKYASGNPGSFNMLRTYGFFIGILTLLLDAIKGAIPALIGLYIFGGATNAPQSIIALYATGLSVIIGHIYPIIYKFKGGKGVASTLGVFFVANPLWTLIFFALAFLEVLIFDYGSIASFICITGLLIVELVHYQGNLAISILIITIFLLVMVAHRKNIARLIAGKEHKAGFRSSVHLRNG
ncbi:MAG: glycerol-3-phosphate acyltransferase [Clostridia bacterium]